MPSSREQKNDEDAETRRGPWTLEEDTILTHYIACNGEGRWNLLARCSGLKRTGKSCRLRWLNYLKPDVKRGNLTPQEQLLILELHSKWGNRWSRIAQHLPGRTDNEIKNYWRTRVQKQARQLKIDANSSRFRDAIRCFWMPRLLQKIESSSSSPLNSHNLSPTQLNQTPHTSSPPQYLVTNSEQNPPRDSDYSDKSSSENCSPSISTNSMKITQIPEILEFPASPPLAFGNIVNNPLSKGYYTNTNCDLEALDPVSTSAVTGYDYALHDCTVADNNWVYDVADSLWNMDEFWNVRKISGRGL